ncbi:hypothetical protein PFLUV_G00165390 [Perca fluviatilis]|uniref:SEA domain-containing protein n=1 Tax=Perca fluviatilis TaxID=8168 RepID=A0A6A5EY42_PERFL|nr:hypothetical protein PFLUV_G00165390 [Perca fluviatilis]
MAVGRIISMFLILIVLVVQFVEELTNKNSIQFKNLEAEVVAEYNSIYRKRFDRLFIRSFVIRFSQAITRIDNTVAEVGIEFNQTASPSEIPKADVVAQTLVEAVSNPNNTFNLTVDATSITVIQINSTTAAPTLNTTAAIPAAANPTTNTMISTTTASTTTSTAATTTTTTEAVTLRLLTFRSAGETFTIDLQNPSTTAFTNRASIIKSTLEPFYKKEFSSFRFLTVISFSSGSIISNLALAFSSTSIPNDTQIGSVLVRAASNITAFNVDTTSIFVDGTQVSSGVSHKISLITASFLVMLSWLLSSQQ